MASGKMVWEIQPNIQIFIKGKAVREILKTFPLPRGFLAIYLGDDQTDEICLSGTQRPRDLSFYRTGEIFLGGRLFSPKP